MPERSPRNAEFTYEAYGPYEVRSPAPSSGESPGAHEHEGLLVRVTVGFGAARGAYHDAADASVDTKGLAFLASVSVGGRIYDNLLLHGDLLLADVGDAQRHVDGVRDARDDISTKRTLVALGISYYLMPSNVYFSGGLGAGRMIEARDGTTGPASKVGIGGYLMVGKEWWVGRKQAWGVGGALRGSFLHAPIEVERTGSVLFGSDIGVVFSTTYN